MKELGNLASLRDENPHPASVAGIDDPGLEGSTFSRDRHHPESFRGYNVISQLPWPAFSRVS